MSELTAEVRKSPSTEFLRLSQEGLKPLASVMKFTLSGDHYRALSVICHNDNWRKVAFALALVFHTHERTPVRVQIAKGFDRLRDLVTSCVTHLRKENWKGLAPEDGNYSVMIQRVFTIYNHSAP